MASSLASILTLSGGLGFHLTNSQLHYSQCGVGPFLQQSSIVRATTRRRRPLVVAATVGGTSSESLVEDPTPSTSSSAEDREQARANRRRKGFEEYEALKKELSSTTIGVAAAVDAYIFLTLSPQSAVSYTIGALGSYLYLQLLYRHADSVSEENTADIFQKRRKKTIGIRSSDVQESLEKMIRGCGISLSSPRLVIPAALYALWAVSTHFTGTSNHSFHLELCCQYFFCSSYMYLPRSICTSCKTQCALESFTSLYGNVAKPDSALYRIFNTRSSRNLGPHSYEDERC